MKYSAEARRKMSNGGKRSRPSKKAIEKLRRINLGKKLSEETKGKISQSMSREKHHSWKGGKFISRGYIYVKCESHPYADHWGYVREHRLVMEAHIGRVLLPTEVVHHINGDKTDNRIENLMLFSSNKKHMKHHAGQGDLTGRPKGEVK